MSWHFEAELFRWQGDAAWHFLRLPVEVAEDLRDSLTQPPGGFGSVRVVVGIGATEWTTSVFPDKDSGSYLLPVRKAVRTAEGLQADDVVGVRLELEGERA